MLYYLLYDFSWSDQIFSPLTAVVFIIVDSTSVFTLPRTAFLFFFFFYSFLHVTNAERGQARLRLNGPRSCLGEEDDNYTHEMTGGSNFQTFFLFQQ